MSREDLLLQNVPMTGPIPESLKQKARMTVCSEAVDAEEASKLLSMLGLL